MSVWRQLTHGLRGLTRRTAVDQDVSDEVDHYFDQATAALVARGVPLDEARRAVRLELGTAALVREQARDYGWDRVVGAALGDLRYALRQLRGSPGFTTVVVLTLALGIGATTAIFSAVNPILFEPLPYPHAARLAMISDFGPAGLPQDVTFGTFLELVDRSRSFEVMAVVKPWQPTMIADLEPERLTGQRVSAGYFRALGVPPMLGRDFQPSDDRLDGPRVVILSHALWTRRLGADAAVVGREVTLDDRSFLVIGVMPPGFENVLAASAEAWAPLQYSTSLTPDGREWGHHLKMIGRLQPNAGLGQGRRELDAIARNPRPEFPRVPWASLQQGLVVSSLQHELTRAVRPALVAMLGAVLLVLGIACVNVTNLLLARGVRRRGEFAMRTMDSLLARSEADRRFALILFEAFGLVALVLAATGIYGVLSGSVSERTREIGVRAALGASRADILTLVARQGLTLTGLGMLVGLTGAFVASEAIVTLLFGVSRLDPVTYGGVAALLLTVAVLASAIPAWRAARVDPAITLRAE
jgi:putative ABC transport system permease protein